VLAATGYLALALWSHAGELGASLPRFRAVFLVPVPALVLANYGLRFARWHYLLRLGGAHVAPRESAALFLSGFAMSITPGRMGELMKSVMLRDEAGVPLGVSIPVVIADRANDGVAAAVLVAAGMAGFSGARSDGGRPVRPRGRLRPRDVGRQVSRASAAALRRLTGRRGARPKPRRAGRTCQLTPRRLSTSCRIAWTSSATSLGSSGG
jgi:hypothetical protein